jgi:CRP-like cAMP-binding protein
VTSPPEPRQNALLRALPSDELAALLPALTLVETRVGDVLYAPGGQLQHAFFPTSAIVSLHYVMASGVGSESAGVGNEGVVGVSLFMGGLTTTGGAVVQTSGHGYRLSRQILQAQFARGGALRPLLLRYTQVLITQIAQTAVCNRHHCVEQQLCRWLLTTLDRLDGRELVMTQELIANMLGVRREGITEAAGKLQRAQYIRYRRGHIAVLDRSGLEAHSCECYGVVKAERQRLLR